jgi:hypothetical protein
MSALLQCTVCCAQSSHRGRFWYRNEDSPHTDRSDTLSGSCGIHMTAAPHIPESTAMEERCSPAACSLCHTDKTALSSPHTHHTDRHGNVVRRNEDHSPTHAHTLFHMSTLSPHTSSRSRDSAHSDTTPPGSLDTVDRVLGDRERRSCAHTLAAEVSCRSLHMCEGVTTDQPVDQSNTPREREKEEIQNLHTST